MPLVGYALSKSNPENSECPGGLSLIGRNNAGPNATLPAEEVADSDTKRHRRLIPVRI
jgi:hypothetical protein